MKKKLSLLIFLTIAFIKVNGQTNVSTPYCFPNTPGSSGDYVDGVQLGSINNVGTGLTTFSGNYVNYSNMSTNLIKGVTYHITVYCGSYCCNNNIGVWIDYNQNNLFDPGELIGSSMGMPLSSFSILTFTVPTTAHSGTTRMRVRECYNLNNNGGVWDPCTNNTTFIDGETEDYTINIIPTTSNDISTIAVLSPTTGCSLTNSEYITATFFNSGTDTIFSFTAAFNVLTSSSTGSQLVNNTILPHHSLNYTFTIPANFSTPGLNNFQVFARLPNDTIYLDDTINTSVANYSSVNTFPFIENCNGANLSAAARVTIASNAQAFLSPIALNTGSGGFLMTGSSTYSSPYYSQPTYGTEWTTNAAYDSKIDYCVDARNLTSGCGLQLKFDMKQTANAYFYNSTDIFNSSFRVLINGVQISPTYHPSVANLYSSNDPYITYTFNLQSYIGTGFNITFEGRCRFDSTYYGSSPGDNVYLDNIKIIPHPPVDMSIMKIIEPISSCGHTSADSVKAKFQNLGCNTIAQGTSIPLSYKFGTNSIITENYIVPHPIALYDSFVYTFSHTINDAAPNLYSLKVFTSMPADSDYSDDTLVDKYLSVPTITSYPWTDGFESTIFWQSQPINGASNWTILTNSVAMVSPAISAHGGANLAYYPYANGNNAQADLISPCFDFSHLNQPIIRFYLGQYNSAYASVWLKLYGSINGGATYNYIDSFTLINAGSGFGWPGGWQAIQECLNSYAHQSNVKFKFRSHGHQYTDIGIDDVSVFEGLDTTRLTISKDTLCTGQNISITMASSVYGRNYFIVDKNNNAMGNSMIGTGGSLIFNSVVLTQDTLLQISYSDSIPYTYCPSYLATKFNVKVYPYTHANAGVDTFYCSGLVAHLHGSGGTTYQWFPNLDLSPNPYVSNPTANPLSTTTYVLLADNPGHCSSTDTMVLSVHQGPSANAGPNQLICLSAASSIQIGGSPTASGGSGTYNFSWVPTNGIIPTIANPTASPSVTTTYTIRVNDFNGCWDTSSMTVFVDPIITTTLTTNNISCNGVNDGFASISIAGGSTPYYISWTVGSIQTGTSVSNLSPNTYNVYVTDNLGCSKTDNFTITQPSPLNLLMNTFTTTCGQCNGMVVPIIIGGTTPYNYSWSNGSTNDSLLNACNQKYHLQVSDAHGCTIKDSATVTGPAGTTTFIANAGSNLQMCVGDMALLGGAPTLYGGTLPYTFAWTPNTALNNAMASNPIANPTTTTTYHVTATDNNGCTKSDSIVVIVHPNPIANAGSDLTYCKLAHATLGTTALSGYTYQWSPSTGLTQNNIANPTVDITATITYTLAVTNSYGCHDTDNVVVTVNAEPLINAGSDVIIYAGNSTNLTATGAASYTWAPPTGLNSTIGASVMANPNTTTTYVVTGTNALGCTSTDTVVVYVISSTGIDEISNKIDLKIYPNPFAQNVTIDYSLPLSETLDVLLFNISGRLEKTILSGKQEIGNHRISLNAEDLSSGNYLLYIKTDDGIVVKKIIKQQ